MDSHTGSKFYLCKTEFSAVGQAWFYYHHYSLPEAQAKPSPPCYSREPPTHPWGQITFETAQAQINSAGLQANRLLEPREKCAFRNFCHQNWEYIWSESLRQIPSLCISASPSVQLCRVWHTQVKGTTETRKVTEQNGKMGAKQTQSAQIFRRWLFIHSPIVSGALRSLNCDKGPTVANWVFSLITFDVVLKAVCQLLESFDYIQVLLQSKQAQIHFYLFVSVFISDIFLEFAAWRKFTVLMFGSNFHENWIKTEKHQPPKSFLPPSN